MPVCTSACFMEQNKTLIMALNLKMSMRFLPCACGIENAAAIVLCVPTYPLGLLLTHFIPQAKQDRLLTTMTATIKAFIYMIRWKLCHSVLKKQDDEHRRPAAKPGNITQTYLSIGIFPHLSLYFPLSIEVCSS